MKFDKIMEITFRVLACLMVIVTVVGCVSCCIDVNAVDITVEEQAGINEYLDTYAENLNAIDFEFNSDQDGNRSARLKIYGIQQLALQDMTSIYDNMDVTLAPDTVTFSGSGASGIYKSRLDNNYHGFTAYSNSIEHGNRDSISFPVASSDEFQYVFTCNFPSIRDCWVSPTSDNYNGGLRINNTVYDQAARSNVSWSLIDTMGHYGGGSGSFLDYYNNYAFLVINSSEGSISYPNYATRYFGSSGDPYFQIGFSGQSISLPSGTVDTLTPWDYYNNIVLPELELEFPDFDDYFVFPDGYSPTQDPTEPPNINVNVPVIAPVIIGSGNIITVDGIDFDIFAPIKGQLVIDGITFQFPNDGTNRVFIDKEPFTIPMPETEIKGHTIELPDIMHLIFDGIEFLINADGSLTIDNVNYPLPIGVPETMPSGASDYVYKYEIPTLENINIVDADLSAPDLFSFGDSVNFVFTVSHDIFEDIGAFPVILACFSIAALGFALWKIGG